MYNVNLHDPVFVHTWDNLDLVRFLHASVQCAMCNSVSWSADLSFCLWKCSSPHQHLTTLSPQHLTIFSPYQLTNSQSTISPPHQIIASPSHLLTSFTASSLLPFGERGRSLSLNFFFSFLLFFVIASIIWEKERVSCLETFPYLFCHRLIVSTLCVHSRHGGGSRN